jgi:two-component system cell cycle sensor histidine kinase/response regulator CckA
MTHVLIVDDNQQNRYLLEVLLEGHGYTTVSAVNGEEALASARRHPPDLVIADILMPVMDGYSLCRHLKADTDLDQIPLIFYTATYTEAEDREFALGLGAERFIIKPQDPEDLIRIISEVLQQRASAPGRDKAAAERLPEKEFLERHNKALSRKLEKKMTQVKSLHHDLNSEISQRRQLEEKLAEAEAMFHDILDAAPMAMTFTDKVGGMLYVNKQFVHLFGYGRQELPDLETWFAAAYPNACSRETMQQLWQNAVHADGQKETRIEPVEACIRCKDGSGKNVSVLEAFISDIHLTAYHDLTEHSALVSQLIQAQKMEAIGHYAGGLAHDFNNILTAIVGYGQLLMTTLPPEAASRRYAEQILSASERGEKLTSSLFSFSRKQKMEEKPVELNHIISGAEDILARLIKDSVELKCELCDGPTTIMADTNQMEQVLMNLVKNASDAIEGRGRITIGTQRVKADEQVPGLKYGCSAGPHILLTVTDTGHGMEEETCQNIFKPFYTRKEKGKGTGLGLSVVRGIVKRHKGRIVVDTTPGKGTSFNLYLPASALTQAPDPPKCA